MKSWYMENPYSLNYNNLYSQVTFRVKLKSFRILVDKPNDIY